MVETRRLSTHVSIRHHLIFPCQIILLARPLTLTMGIFDCRYRFTTSLTRRSNCGNLFSNTLSIEMHSLIVEIPTGTMSKKVFLYAQCRYFLTREIWHLLLACGLTRWQLSNQTGCTGWGSNPGMDGFDSVFYHCSTCVCVLLRVC